MLRPPPVLTSSLCLATRFYPWPPPGLILPRPTPPRFPDVPFPGSTGVVDTRSYLLPALHAPPVFTPGPCLATRFYPAHFPRLRLYPRPLPGPILTRPTPPRFPDVPFPVSTGVVDTRSYLLPALHAPPVFTPGTCLATRLYPAFFPRLRLYPWPLPGLILSCPTPPRFPDAPFPGSTGVVDTWSRPRPAPSLARQVTDFTPGLWPSLYFCFLFSFCFYFFKMTS